ncbi:thioredoxin domain-containing protein [Paenibacillus psychroresistens]|uniref:Thioredoxin domain-containing protein n=1 Tax=Paenibacillus psychroresistens TaxID=1778678 RepID=A0A6B8RL33_9BACL|nr:thioredoxin domain-containing protein [Paenibacillus psychroresistens]QGQ96749.1 thioredoxin domain-containing protein [Paenibacillus psychroresistens]
MATNSKPNRLSQEKSPYLLQHAHNPVNWYSWSDEAFELAAKENKPIFLSIGYSTCHWCHVMEKESFEDEEVAEVLNANFISIKVDREERPDVDHLYMAVCQAMTGAGGWPLTIIMTPEKKPFFAGTYFPKRRKNNRFGVMDLLGQVTEKWNEDREKIIDAGNQIVAETQKRMLSNLQGEISTKSLEKAYGMYEQMFDPMYGGFGTAPKFPTSHNLSLLLRNYLKTNNAKALQMVEKTLDFMYRGGLYDHVGFGFSRYSTDERWLVPHFEKMLYDNALLAMTNLEAYQVTGKAQYAETAEQIFAYVLRDMTDVGGAFYCAEDADSEGVEGKFYVWKPQEIIEVLGQEIGELYCELYDITVDGNFEEDNIPNLINLTVEEFAKLKQMPLEELKKTIEEARQKLFIHREARIHPHKDDKILTSWNGLFIMALAKGAKVLQKPVYAVAAQKAVSFILTNMRNEDGRLLARYRDGEAAFPGYVDDYAFMVWGLIELYEATFDISYIKQAIELNQQMLDLFWDEQKGGLFFYGNDSEQLFIRPKEIYDGAMPSGNSAAALNLQKLARYTFNAALSQKADQQLKAFAGAVEGYPAGHALFMAAIDFAYSPSSEVVIAGDLNAEDTQAMIRAIQTRYAPNTLIMVNPTGDGKAEVEALIPLMQGKNALGGKATAYVCENFSCQSPTSSIEELLDILK